ncbi:uncharacterized protein LOC144671979 isoform X2 [Cetorhinus maximus]
MNEILAILDELSSEEMERFKFRLGDNGIPAGKLEKADATKLFDLIQKTFLDEAQRLRVIQDGLKAIPRMDLVGRLNKLQGGDVPDGKAKKSKGRVIFNARSKWHPQEHGLAKVQPINTGKVGEGLTNSGERQSKDYGRDSKLRNSCMMEIALGLIIIILATTAAITMSHRPLIPLRVPWWPGVLFSVIGIIPMLPLKKHEIFKLTVVFFSNIFGLLIALISLGLSIWNGIEETSNAKDTRKNTNIKAKYCRCWKPETKTGNSGNTQWNAQQAIIGSYLF